MPRKFETICPDEIRGTKGHFSGSFPYKFSLLGRETKSVKHEIEAFANEAKGSNFEGKIMNLPPFKLEGSFEFEIPYLFTQSCLHYVSL